MKAHLQVGEVSAPPGAKVSGFFSVPGTSVRIPVTLVNGAAEGPTLLITAGLHGGEYPCIEAAIRFQAELNPAEVRGQIIVIPIASPDSFLARQAFLVPADGKNLNRQFPGKATGTVSERMAHAILTGAGAQSDVWIDMHGGDIPEALLPFMGYEESPDPAVNERSRALAAVFGIEFLIRPDHLPGTSLSAAASLGIPGLLVEAGQLGILDEPSTQILLRGCHNVGRHLGILPGQPDPVGPVREFAHWPWVRAAHTGCWYPRVRVGDTVETGQVVGLVKDYFGNLLAEYTAPHGGLVLLVCMPLAIRENDPLIGIAHD